MKKAVKKKKTVKKSDNENVNMNSVSEPETDDSNVFVIVEEYSDPDEDDPEYIRKLKEERKAERKAEKRAKKHAADLENNGGVPEKNRKKKKHIFLKILLTLIVVWFTAQGILTIYFHGMKVEALKKSYSLSGDITTSIFVSNILVIGTDTRNPEAEAGRSDCIMLLSLNRLTRKIEITSFLRDCYVSIPGHSENRINAAFQYGGAPLLIQTIEENFKIGIDDYVIIDFYSCMDIIDAVGGVNIDVTAEEANYVNMYLCEINQLLGIEQGDGNLLEHGNIKLNGKQALAYSRIRYIGTDFGRTDRQREVITSLISSAKSSNPFTLLSNLKKVFPEITTSLSACQLGNYAMELPFLAFYAVEQQRVPADGTWSDYITDSGMDVLKLDFDANIKKLLSSIYNK